MSASNVRVLDATGRRSGAAAPARRTDRKYRPAVGSNWLKTMFPANSRTAVGAPGEATVSAEARAGSARTASAAAAPASRRRIRGMSL
jgi:hypothetical protein